MGLGVSLNLKETSFSSEIFSFNPFKGARIETMPAELILSVGRKQKEILMRGGARFGLTEGIGSPKFGIFLLLSYEMEVPKSPLSIYGIAKEKITGFPIEHGFIFVKETGEFFEINDGKFYLTLPEEGAYELYSFSPSHEGEEKKIHTNVKEIEIFMEKIQPKLILSFIDYSNSITTGKIRVKTQNNEETVEGKYTVFSEPGIYTLEEENGEGKELILPENKYVWISIPKKEKLERIEQIKEDITEEKPIERMIYGFEVDKWEIPTDSINILKEVIEIIRKNIGKIERVVIWGHADITGPEWWNIELSYLRAIEVKKHILSELTSLNFPVDIEGFGSSKPIDTNDTQDGRRKNRRVEIKIFISDKEKKR